MQDQHHETGINFPCWCLICKDFFIKKRVYKGRVAYISNRFIILYRPQQFFDCDYFIGIA